jgi:hypothetical protein
VAAGDGAVLEANLGAGSGMFDGGGEGGDDDGDGDGDGRHLVRVEGSTYVIDRRSRQLRLDS